MWIFELKNIIDYLFHLQKTLYVFYFNLKYLHIALNFTIEDTSSTWGDDITNLLKFSTSTRTLKFGLQKSLALSSEISCENTVCILRQ